MPHLLGHVERRNVHAGRLDLRTRADRHRPPVSGKRASKPIPHINAISMQYESSITQLHTTLSSSSSDLLRLLRPIFTPTRHPRTNTTQVQCASNKMISHTRTVLRPATTNQHHTMLLHVMSFSRYICRHHPSGR